MVSGRRKRAIIVLLIILLMVMVYFTAVAIFAFWICPTCLTNGYLIIPPATGIGILAIVLRRVSRLKPTIENKKAAKKSGFVSRGRKIGSVLGLSFSLIIMILFAIWIFLASTNSCVVCRPPGEIILLFSITALVGIILSAIGLKRVSKWRVRKGDEPPLNSVPEISAENWEGRLESVTETMEHRSGKTKRTVTLKNTSLQAGPTYIQVVMIGTDFIGGNFVGESLYKVQPEDGEWKNGEVHTHRIFRISKDRIIQQEISVK